MARVGLAGGLWLICSVRSSRRGSQSEASFLASEIRKSTRSFLVSSCEASDGFFHGVMQRFVDREHSIDKGPYLQVGLPLT